MLHLASLRSQKTTLFLASIVPSCTELTVAVLGRQIKSFSPVFRRPVKVTLSRSSAFYRRLMFPIQHDGGFSATCRHESANSDLECCPSLFGLDGAAPIER